MYNMYCILKKTVKEDLKSMSKNIHGAESDGDRKDVAWLDLVTGFR